MKERLAKKTEGLSIPLKKDFTGNNSPKTGPGQMLMVTALMKDANEKIESLENQLRSFNNALVVKNIDPHDVVWSKWANRLKINFDSKEYRQFKDEISVAGGNVQPIKVRPIPGTEKYEIIFGHRRHQACLDLNLPVSAIVEELSDSDLFKEMDRENRNRKDLSPWEQGLMYRRALDEKLFSSIGDLSRELGVDKSAVSKSIRLAQLPEEIVRAFPSPLDLQFRWTKPLCDALQENYDAVLQRANEIFSKRSGLSAKQILDLLLNIKATNTVFPLNRRNKLIGEVSCSANRIVISLEKPVLSSKAVDKFREALNDWANQIDLD